MINLEAMHLQQMLLKEEIILKIYKINRDKYKNKKQMIIEVTHHIHLNHKLDNLKKLEFKKVFLKISHGFKEQKKK